MDFYPAELTTPPLALVALVGLPEMHASMRDFLRSHQKPPINTIGLSTPNLSIFGEPKAQSCALPTSNLLKADWFAKHRQTRPAVAVVLLGRDWVVGDPNSWTRACELLDRVRASTKPRAVRLVVAIVQDSGPAAEVPDERVMVLRRRTDLDSRCLVPLSRHDGDISMKRLGRVILEQASAFYADEVRRVLSKAAERVRVVTGPAYAFNIRSAFKAAAFSEFRQDWSTALRQYQAAYAHCQEAMSACLASPASAGLVQHHAEICAVAEQIHIKLMSLMLHQQRIPDALAQVESHISSFRHLPPGAQPASAAAHWSWARRQYTVAGELLGNRVSAETLPDRRSAQPAFFFQCAARAVAMERSAAMGCTPPSQPETEALLVQGPYVGQMWRPATEGGGGRAVTDDEYENFLASREAGTSFSQQRIEMLSRAYEGYKKYTAKKEGGGEVQRASRTIYHLAHQMAVEYLSEGEPSTARRLLDSVAAIYRKERWELLLASALYTLRDVATRLSLVKAHVEYSLELSSLSSAVVDAAQAKAIAQTAVATLLAGSGGSEGEGGEGAPTPLVYPVAPGSGVASALQMVAGFCPQDPNAGSSDYSTAKFGVAFFSSLPVEIPVAHVDVTFADSNRNHTLQAMWEEIDDSAGQAKDGKAALGVLVPRQWQRCWVSCDLPSGTIVKAAAVAMKVGGAQLLWDLSNCPRDSSYADKETYSEATAVRVGAAQAVPEVSLVAPSACLVGERLPVRCVVSTSGAPLCSATLSFDLQCNGPDDSQCPELLLKDSLAGVSKAGNPLAAGDAVSGTLALPRVLRGQPLVLELTMPASQVGVVSISASLCSQAISFGSEQNLLQATSKENMAKATASSDIKVEAPFQLLHSLSAPPHVHILLPPTSKATQDAQPSGFMCVPCGHPFILSASLHSAARCQVQLKSVDLLVPEDGGLKVVASCGTIREGQDGMTGALLSKGSAYTVLFQLATPKAPGQVQLGCIRLRWHRETSLFLSDEMQRQPNDPTVDVIAEQMQAVTLSDAKEPAGPPGSGDTTSCRVDVRPDRPEQELIHEVETMLPLPSLWAEEPVILASTEAPPQATAGDPFTYSVRIENPGNVLQDVTVSVGDASGFVFSGERHGTVSVLPLQTAHVSWTMVAYNAGQLTLPDIQLTSVRYSTCMRVTSSSQLFVMPMKPSVNLKPGDLMGINSM